MKTSVLQQNKNNYLQSFFLASSIYCAIIIIALYTKEHFRVQNIGLQTQSISIALSQIQPQTQQKQPPTPKEPIPTPPKEPTKIIKKKPIAKPITKPKAKQEPIPKTQTQSQDSQTKQSQIAQISQQAPSTLTFGQVNDPFLLSIKQAIDRHLHYPRKARMLHLTGITTIEFTLLTSGEVKDIKIIQSSNHDILDKSAIKTIADAASSFPIPKNNVTIQIPIQYILS